MRFDWKRCLIYKRSFNSRLNYFRCSCWFFFPVNSQKLMRLVHVRVHVTHFKIISFLSRSVVCTILWCMCRFAQVLVMQSSDIDWSDLLVLLILLVTFSFRSPPVSFFVHSFIHNVRCIFTWKISHFGFW